MFISARSACRSSVVLSAIVALGLSIGGPSFVRAERPAAPKLLPRDTMAYVRVHDTRELIAAFNETSGGRIANDDKIRPLIGHLYGSLTQAFANATTDLGMTLDELLSIPQGELCLAFIFPEEGQPGAVLILEAGAKLPVAERLLEVARRQAANDGTTISTESVGDTELQIFERNGRVQGTYFIREQTIVVATDLDIAKDLLGRWNGAEGETLADNRRFTTIMSRSQGTKDERPQATFFVQPFDIAKRATRGNLAASSVIAILTALGVDGLQAIGGGVILNTEEFDSIMHVHVMLASPREQALKMIAFEPGEITPEPWVPSDLISYTTVHWNAAQMFEALEPLYNTFRGEGALAADIQSRINEPAGIDFRKDLLEAFDNRITIVGWMEPPARLNSQANLIALRMKDGEAFAKTLDGIMQKVAPDVETKTFRGIKYYRVQPIGPRRRFAEQTQGDELFRQPEPALAVVDNYVMMADSVKLLQEVLEVRAGEKEPLGTQLDFKLIASKFKQHSLGKKPAMISFSRPEEGLRIFYDLATSNSTRDRLAGAAESNPFFRALHEALKENELPPFADIAKYLAPSGAIVIDDETGIHYTAFGLKRQ